MKCYVATKGDEAFKLSPDRRVYVAGIIRVNNEMADRECQRVINCLAEFRSHRRGRQPPDDAGPAG
jgi:hypothetical protein